jgi:hypothetical protein
VLPADFPAAIASVMHLASRHTGMLPGILSSRTALKVKQARAGDIRPLYQTFGAGDLLRLVLLQLELSRTCLDGSKFLLVLDCYSQGQSSSYHGTKKL